MNHEQYSRSRPQVLAPRITDFSAQLIFVPRNNTLYVFPPKCAQTSLRKWVGTEGVVSPMHFREVPQSALVIMSVRNPIERIASAWANKYPETDFRQFVLNCCKHTDEALDIHCQAQSHLLRRAGFHRPDYYIRVDDNLIPDILRLRKQVGWVPEGNPKHENAQVRQTGLSLITQHGMDLFNLIEARYAEDFKLWEIANA